MHLHFRVREEFQLNVLLDMQVLGIGMQNPNARRGIYRYAKDLTISMSRRYEINLSLCSSERWQCVGSCRDYLKEHPSLKETPFIQDISNFDNIIIRYFKAFDYAAKFKSRGLKKILLKALLREPLRSALKIRHKFVGNILSSRDLADFEIYFSLDFPAIPDVIRGTPWIKNFTVVHDIIPLITPQYVTESRSLVFSEKLRRLKREDWIFTVSKWSKNDLCNYAANIDPDRVIVNPLAAANHFYPCNEKEKDLLVRMKYGIPQEGKYLLSLGALEKRKNLPVIFEVFEKLVFQEKIQDLSLVLVGHANPDYVKALKGLPSYQSIQKHVFFTGHVPDEDLSPLYSNATAFIFPSHYEGFGLPPLEAMQCGVPVVSSNSSSLPEVVGDAGVLVAPHDSDGMAEAVLKILRDRSYREILSKKSIERARQFSWDAHALMAVQSFKKALA